MEHENIIIIEDISIKNYILIKILPNILKNDTNKAKAIADSAAAIVNKSKLKI